MSQTEFWTAEELAARLRVTKATIYRMARRGELPYYSIGRAMRFRNVDVEAFLEKCRAVEAK
jgi:putative molybdopterin biosynthesis protein